MRQFKFLSVAAALLAVSTLFTSCWRNDDPVNSAKVTAINGALYSIYATSNLNATFSIDVAGVEAKSNVTTAFFQNLTAGTVKITAKYTGADAADYENATQTTTVNFSELSTSAAVMFTFVKKSTTSKSQSDVNASGAELNNDDTAVGKATLKLSAGTNVTNGVLGNYSISVYNEGVVIMKSDDISVGTSLPLVVYYLDCQPDGATLNIPAQITIDYGTLLAGTTVNLEFGSESVSAVVGADGKATFDVSKLVLWKSILSAKVDAVENGNEILTTLNIPANKGVNHFQYKKNVGIETTLTGYLAAYLNGVFGFKKTQVEEWASFETDGKGDATVTISQNKKVYTLNFMGKTFKVTVWGNVAYKVDLNGETTTKGHSGGSGH